MLGVPFVAFLAVCGWAWFRASRPAQTLSEDQAAAVRSLPERRRNQHLVDVTLDNGRVINGVYVAYGRYVVPGLLPRRRVRTESIRQIRQHPR